MDLHAALGLAADAVVTPGPRGALGRIWRVDDGPVTYAVKQIFGTPPSRATIEAELTFARHAARAGVAVPAYRPGPGGGHLHRAPDGSWLRLLDWVDLRAAGPGDPAASNNLRAPGDPAASNNLRAPGDPAASGDPAATAGPAASTDPPPLGDPAALGELLARLHRGAPATGTEPDGGPPDPWYHRPPPADAWPDMRGTIWSDRVADRLRTVPALCAALAPPDPAATVLCHRDLHPGNVLRGPDGTLVVVDLDQVGPAEPGRELARFLFDWCSDGAADRDAMRALYDAYLRAGGPGRITAPRDFTMLVASRLNFLVRQLRIVTDPAADAHHRAWAADEIEEALRILPSPGQLADALAIH